MIFSATNAMQHLLDLDSVLDFLMCAHRHLAQSGRLVLDVFNPALEKIAGEGKDRHFHKAFKTKNNEPVRVEVETQYDRSSQLLEFQLFYFINGVVSHTKKVAMRCFFPKELIAIFRLAGFEVEHKFGNYDESNFASDSPKQIFVLQKA